MIRSRNEIAGMALKAARGAGVPLGHAEDFARAVDFMAESEMLLLSNALSGPFDVAVTESPLIFSGPTIMVAPMAIDAIAAGEQSVALQGAHPEALLNAYFHYARQAYGLCVNFSDGVVMQSSDLKVIDMPAEAINVPDTIWQQWNDLAGNTYVPETEASRLSGAGAGLTDND